MLLLLLTCATSKATSKRSPDDLLAIKIWSDLKVPWWTEVFTTGWYLSTSPTPCPGSSGLWEVGGGMISLWLSSAQASEAIELLPTGKGAELVSGWCTRGHLQRSCSRACPDTTVVDTAGI